MSLFTNHKGLIASQVSLCKASNVALVRFGLGWLCQVSTLSFRQAHSSSVKPVVLQPPFSGLDSPACVFKAYPDRSAWAMLTLPTLWIVAQT